MKAIQVVDTIDEAWLGTLEKVSAEPNGQAVHVVTTVSRPVSDDLLDVSCSAQFHSALDANLLERHANWQPIDTVAETIFPDSLYRWDDVLWSTDLDPDSRHAIEQRAAHLFRDYVGVLPLIRKAKANADRWDDTYFGRLIDWKGYNQLDYWIKALRKKRAAHSRTFKEVNLALAGEGELGLGGQLRAAGDQSHLGGPCLVHLDLSLLDSRLHLMANYRHWYLQERAYGNLVGLANLLRFVSQQTGYLPGELVVVSGVANAQHTAPGGKTAVDGLMHELRQLASFR